MLPNLVFRDFMSQKKTKFQLFRCNHFIIKRGFTWGYSLLFILFFCFSSALFSCNSQLINNSTAAKTKNAPSNLTRVVRIGHQRFGALFYLKAKGSLATRLAEIGWSVEWT